MIEGGDELGCLLAQEAVAEHVARHVADADHGERRHADIDVHLAEMTLDRFPGAARGDAHLLVVVAGGAARGEGIAKPEIVRDRDLVGDVGEGRRALVGGDDEIGIVAVVAHDVGRRHDADRSGADIVGDVEQRRDEQPVGGRALGLDRLARAAGGQPLGDEAAFRPDRDDHRILDVLRFDQAEDLGAEILRPVGPADAAARHLAEAQMHALDARRIDEDLVKRPRQRHAVDFAAGKFEGDELLGAAVAVALVEIGADRRRDRVEEAAQDAVFVETVDRLQGGLDLRHDGRLARRAFVRRNGELRIEPGVEQRDDLGGDAGMLAQRRPHVILRERNADLAQEA